VMLLPWPVGPKTAKEIILLGEDRLSAARAEAIGIVNRVIPAAKLEATTLTVARDLAAIAPELVRRTRPAINRTFDARGMLGALEEALTIDLLIEGEGSPDKIQFMTIARREGLKAALARYALPRRRCSAAGRLHRRARKTRAGAWPRRCSDCGASWPTR
jgi:enoyl-CoA hydratase